MVRDEKNSSSDIGHITNGTWLISFADLLTLLLCAFILYFSQTYADKPKTLADAGTQVAHTVSEPPKNNLMFYANDVLDGGGFLASDRIKVVKNAVDLGFYEGERVVVSLCQGAFSKELASNFLTLLDEAGVPEGRIDIRFFGTECSAVDSAEKVRGEPVARLEILKGI